ncbi:MAG TPA: MinD/ParA family protein [Lachnospiraceae bacterium]|nr:MinD/ParA family protein [Lachnospiraceae bacterium]
MDQAERLRNIIKRQQYQPEMPQSSSRVITVTSGKGGVGKTSVSVNLAISLARMGKRVVILDADFGLANIEIMLGIRPQFNLADLMFRGKGMRDIITYGPENIGFISGGSGINEMANLNKTQIVDLIQKMAELDQLADIVIVDTGAGIGNSVLEFVAASEEVLLVATPEPTSITDAYALLKSLNRNSSYQKTKTVVELIANQVRTNDDAKELHEKLGVVVNKFLNIDIEFLGAIPYDENMSKAILRQEPIVLSAPNSSAAKSITGIAAGIGNVNLPDSEQGFGIMRLFSSVIRMKFGRK